MSGVCSRSTEDERVSASATAIHGSRPQNSVQRELTGAGAVAQTDAHDAGEHEGVERQQRQRLNHGPPQSEGGVDVAAANIAIHEDLDRLPMGDEHPEGSQHRGHQYSLPCAATVAGAAAGRRTTSRLSSATDSGCSTDRRPAAPATCPASPATRQGTAGDWRRAGRHRG